MLSRRSFFAAIAGAPVAALPVRAEAKEKPHSSDWMLKESVERVKRYDRFYARAISEGFMTADDAQKLMGFPSC